MHPMRLLVPTLGLCAVAPPALGAAGALSPTLALGGAAALAGSAGLLGAVGAMEPSLQWFGHIHLRGRGPGVALSFDDGPHPDSTGTLLDALAAHAARATFFVLGDRALAHGELLRRIASEQELALHGPRHSAHLTWLHPTRGAEHLTAARDRLEQLTGVRVRWYRPPFGAVSPRLFRACTLAGLTPVWCSVRTRDGLGGSERRLLDACGRAGPGDIVLMHEGKRPAVHALPFALESLARRGLRAVSVGAVLAP